MTKGPYKTLDNGQHLGTKFEPFKLKSRPTNGANNNYD